MSILVNHPVVSNVVALARRAPKVEDPSHKLTSLIESDTTKWTSKLGSIQPRPDIFFSGLATTRAQAGGFETQYKLEHDLNVELAKTAQEAGTQVYVLISADGMGLNSRFAYSRMKAEIEEDTKTLDFKHVVFVRPGVIVGPREKGRPIEVALSGLANFLGKISGDLLKNWFAQDADVIAKAAVSAGLKCLNGQGPKEKVWILSQADIIRIGQEEWKNREL